MQNRSIPGFKAVFDQKFILLIHVTLWWCQILPQIFHTKWYRQRDISPPDMLVVIYKLFFSSRRRFKNEEQKFILNVSVSLLWWGRQFRDTRQQLSANFCKSGIDKKYRIV